MKTRVACAMLIAGCALLGAASADDPLCGTVITQVGARLTLQHDLECWEVAGTPLYRNSALNVEADNVTIDLNGYKLIGHSIQREQARYAGIRSRATAYNANLRIMNGTIVGFNQGARIVNATGVKIENIKIINPEGWSGIYFQDSSGVTVRNAHLAGQGPDVNWPAGILFIKVTDASVDHAYVERFGSGIAFDCYDGPEVCEGINSGTLKNNSLKDNYNGVYLSYTAGATVAGTHIVNGQVGITGGDDQPNSQLKVVDNAVFGVPRESGGGGDGIWLPSLRDSVIERNTVVTEMGTGIALVRGSTRNMVRANISVSNGADLHQGTDSTENTWIGNICNSVWLDEESLSLEAVCPLRD